MKIVQPAASTIDYRLNILGIRVWKNACQLIAKSGADWSTVGAQRELPVHVPRNSEELRSASSDTVRLTAYQISVEQPGSDIAAVLDGSKAFAAALHEHTRQSDRGRL